MERKLFAFDIDGTLLDSQKQPLDSTIEALQALRRQGHLVTVATGRSRFHAQEVLYDLEFNNYILCNGAAAFLDHEQIYKNVLDKQELHRFVETAREREVDTAFISLDAAKRSTSIRVDMMDDAMKSFGGVLPQLMDSLSEEEDVYQALAFYNTQDEGQFDEEFSQFRFVRWHENGVDVVPKNGSKAATILYMADRLGIARENVVAFGDGENDREMLRIAGTGIAMGNAEANIQQEADIVTDSNDHDGIWNALRTLKAI